ncbi:hypothetical protein M405DRAFT_788563 [Rhizopogon salebrosus TDB-379]|nr:hypothetical protein M405DRAFT_788563 [Rhizopogon salebrosus TDB-379]
MANITHLHIADVSVVFSTIRLREGVRSAEPRIGDLEVKVAKNRHDDRKTLNQTFLPPITISLQDSFSLHLVYKTQRRTRANQLDDIHFDVNDIFQAYRTQAALGRPERQEYHTTRGNVNIVLGLSGNSSSDGKPDLVPTTDHIFHICPRFRILVIGKSGIGKSSLIHHAFGVENALASNLARGEVNIDTEFVSSQNNRFVLHDSKGFEPGEEDNVNIVQQFFKRRGEMPDLKDRLHAVWLCFETPRTGGRLLETGTERFLKLRDDRGLGTIPVIVVFTKYDELINQMDYELGESELSDDKIEELVSEKAEANLQKFCIEPIERFAIPHAKVSIKDDHKDLLVRLIQITEEHVYKDVAADASVMASVAQRVDHGLKIKALIDVGKREYWKELASCTGAFKDRTAWDCLRVLHTDIVAVCNFNDPHDYLYSDDFRILMVNTVDKLDVGPTATTNPNNTIKAGPSMVEATTGILKVPAGPEVPIVMPIASAAPPKWIHDTYEPSIVFLRRFMSYIVDLTIILQTIYLVSDKDKELSIRAIKRAVTAYHNSSVSKDVHVRVREYVGKSATLDSADRDILDNVIELVNLYSIDRREISALRREVGAVGSADGPSGETW